MAHDRRPKKFKLLLKKNPNRWFPGKSICNLIVAQVSVGKKLHYSLHDCEHSTDKDSTLFLQSFCNPSHSSCCGRNKFVCSVWIILSLSGTLPFITSQHGEVSFHDNSRSFQPWRHIVLFALFISFGSRAEIILGSNSFEKLKFWVKLIITVLTSKITQSELLRISAENWNDAIAIQ